MLNLRNEFKKSVSFIGSVHHIVILLIYSVSQRAFTLDVDFCDCIFTILVVIDDNSASACGSFPELPIFNLKQKVLEFSQ